MHLYVTGRHLELTETIHDYVRRRLVEPVQTHSNAHDVHRMEVQLSLVNEAEGRFGCHVLLQLTQHHDLNVREETHDLYEAIDRVGKRLLRQLADDRARRHTQERHPR